MLNFSGRGMHLNCVKSHEFKEGRNWFRVEVFGSDGNYQAASYIQIGCYWKRFYNQRAAMEERRLIEYTEIKA